jgi:hypothetical protein
MRSPSNLLPTVPTSNSKRPIILMDFAGSEEMECIGAFSQSTFIKTIPDMKGVDDMSDPQESTVCWEMHPCKLGYSDASYYPMRMML